MTLEELLWNVNDSNAIELFSATTNDTIDIFSDKDEVPEEYMDCEVTDIFATINGDPKSTAGCWPCLGIEIEVDD